MSSNQPAGEMRAGGVDWSRLAGDDLQSHPLYPLFYPHSIAVVGASPKGGYGLRVITALTSFGFDGSIYPVNPNYDTIADFPAYPEIGAIPDTVDAVAIAIPSRAVPGVVEQAIAAGARTGIAFGSGFAEAGEDGQSLQSDLRALCGERFPLIGPNCLGIMSYLGGAALWAIPMSGERRKAGAVGLVAQSGNMAHTLMASSRGLEHAYAVSAGNQAVVDAVDVMSFYLLDPRVRVIAAIIEGLGEVAKFRRVAARATEQDVPLVVLKLGRSEKASRAAVAHTGSLTGSDQLYDALFKQYGVIRVDDPDELMETAKLLSADRRPAGTGLGVFASSGGECGLISDLADASGVELPDLPPDARAELLELLPPFANPLNPLDITASGWGNREIYGNVATLLARSPDVDMVACIGDATRNSVPLNATGWDKMIAGMADAKARTNKPIAVINTINDVAYEMTDALAEHGLIHLSGARNAARAIGHAGRYARWRQEHGISGTVPTGDSERRTGARRLLPAAGSGGLSESISKELLRQYGIPVPAGGFAVSLDEALALAESAGYPVVLKIEADGVHHKTEVGGVALGIASGEQLRTEHAALLERVTARTPDARVRGVRVEAMASGLLELIIGGRNDPVFGPIVVVGLGGVLAEALQDASTRLAPVDLTEARAMLGELRGAALLGEFRGRPAVDVTAAAETIVQVSQLLLELPEIQELDLNPVLVGAAGEGCIALDCLAVV